jgi:prepilin-type N-terminal cleavage/methylation domain-containing protein
MKLNGFSLIELMLAGAVFAIFATGIVEALLFGLAADRLGEETTIATQYAAEGIEAVRSLKAKNFDDVAVTTATGIARASGYWALSGTSNTNGKYTRIIAITTANRDGGGDIDESSGDADPDTKKAIVTVSWDDTYRSNS